MLILGIYRSTSNKWIFGICGGIGEQLGVDPLWIRLAAILLAVLPAGLGIPPMVLLYVVLRFLLPVSDEV